MTSWQLARLVTGAISLSNLDVEREWYNRSSKFSPRETTNLDNLISLLKNSRLQTKQKYRDAMWNATTITLYCCQTSIFTSPRLSSDWCNPKIINKYIIFGCNPCKMNKLLKLGRTEIPKMGMTNFSLDSHKC